MAEVYLSICILTYQACDYLRGCLNSIYENPPDCAFEIIIVDNGSTDGTQRMLKSEFPSVELIENPENMGFTAPMNQALRRGVGDYLLLLNPDTLIKPQTFNTLINYMEGHSQVGICGPKVLNTDGTLQKPCRRGESRPLAVFSYFLGLSALFPNSKLFGEYLMNYMDEDKTHEVAGVSGSCMLIRREVINQIGYLDERFFAYQEDADYCFRTRKAGWKIYYVPRSQIIHFGGQGGSRVQPYRSIYHWHRSYWLYYQKNLAADYFILFNWFYYLAMGVKLTVSLLLNLIRRDKRAGRQKPR
jgi:GT2 family glycosyltransferase